MASCEAIAAEFRHEDGSPIFTFNAPTNEWVEHPTEDPPYAVRPVFVGGVAHWPLGDGYMWYDVSLDCPSMPMYRDGVEIDPYLIPLEAQALILVEIWAGASVGSITHNGTTYSWD